MLVLKLTMESPSSSKSSRSNTCCFRNFLPHINRWIASNVGLTQLLPHKTRHNVNSFIYIYLFNIYKLCLREDTHLKIFKPHFCHLILILWNVSVTVKFFISSLHPVGLEIRSSLIDLSNGAACLLLVHKQIC